MKILFAGVAFATMVLSANAQELVQRDSAFSVSETADRLVAAAEGAGATVFARIDHAKGAHSIDAELDDMQVVIFGNPLRVLIYDDGGQTRIAYEDPRTLRDRRSVDGADEAFGAMTNALERLTTRAATE
jgi:uncharacterized protein (DUF302 family)